MEQTSVILCILYEQLEAIVKSFFLIARQVRISKKYHDPVFQYVLELKYVNSLKSTKNIKLLER